MKRRRKRPGEVQTELAGSDLKLFAQLAVRVPGELALRLRRFCQESGQSFNQIVAEALERYLDQKKR